MDSVRVRKESSGLKGNKESVTDHVSSVSPLSTTRVTFETMVSFLPFKSYQGTQLPLYFKSLTKVYSYRSSNWEWWTVRVSQDPGHPEPTREMTFRQCLQTDFTGRESSV